MSTEPPEYAEYGLKLSWIKFIESDEDVVNMIIRFNFRDQETINKLKTLWESNHGKLFYHIVICDRV